MAIGKTIPVVAYAIENGLYQVLKDGVILIDIGEEKGVEALPKLNKEDLNECDN